MRVMCPLAIMCALIIYVTPGFASLYGDPPTERHPWQVHDGRRPRPPVVSPGAQVGEAPTDAIILFDGTPACMEKWEADKQEKGIKTQWRLVDGVLESVKGAGYIRTKESFGDCQLHVEWATPTKVQSESQGRGNSGVFLMGLYEVQVLDCYNNDTYPDGQAGSVYGQNPPLVNVCRPPGQWQCYDVIFRQPRLEDGLLIRPGYLTVIQNGVVVQDHWVLEGPTGHKKRTSLIEHKDKLPMKIQDHGNPVRFRNIWIRELPERSDGGLKGPFTSLSAVAAKRTAIAQAVRQEAANAKGVAKMQLLMESLTYERCNDTEKVVETMLVDYLASLKDMNATQAEKQKGDVLGLRSSMTYLMKQGVLPATYGPTQTADALVKKFEWDKKKKE